MSLFSNMGQFGQQQQQQPGGSLFGNTGSATHQQTGPSLFASTSNPPQQQQPPPSNGPSLFGQSQPNTTNQSSLFGTTNTPANNSNPFQQPQQQQQQQQSQLQPSLSGAFSQGLTASTSANNLQTSTQRDLAVSRLSAAGMSIRDNTSKTVADSIVTLQSKWSPNSPSTSFQTYLYNHVNPNYAPFYQPGSDDDPEKWEAALSKKPGKGYIPVLCRGFSQLGQRVELQARIVNEMRIRLHEMNNSLTAVMRKHQIEVTTRLAAARRRHTQLSQQTLRLAVKTQILRNRGYNLDAAEEGLRKQLQKLEQQVADPGFVGREEDIWARMVGLRERARWLEKEAQKLNETSLQQGLQGRDSNGKAVPEEILAKAKKVLTDYDGQLRLLDKELEEVQKDFREWQEAR